MNIKEMFTNRDKMGTFTIQLPETVIGFLRRKALYLSEEKGKRVTQIELVRHALLETYGPEIKQYLKEKSKKNV